MAKHYEALQRAEHERRERMSGQTTQVTALDWDTTPGTAPRPPGSASLWRRMLRALSSTSAEGPESRNKRRIAQLQPDSYIAEQFRSLRGRIDALATQRPILTVAMTSANPDEGKSTAAVNLALVTAMSVGRQVLLLDCDLRRPTICTSLGIEPRAGLEDVLLDRATLDEAITKVEGMGLEVVGTRVVPPNPSELLASSQMRSLLEEVSRRYDRVILDTPATLGLPDAKTVSELCDGLVMVVRADETPREDVESALEILDRSRVLGLVINGVSADGERYGYY